ncbi:hypothetical protein PHYSODRAFT_337511 [Phytophthora sojae]|uniref:Uncharacterized protein n=1 Tax=Phytophthora sojae (strain P6497) TaxID=1094619 RepID=G5A1D4_PHYSP|nr:hypothetical protein PHYSODRAFT_337511 [Phytophthora sojae]EGZ10733.1 hypothetical protein PHYSODRAFT_337511 [Phytophthora sojae]|eukprot:XP_009533478.1 hypothetical protein PHYSODRAFT_337511 [Phytophthora sojae]
MVTRNVEVGAPWDSQAGRAIRRRILRFRIFAQPVEGAGAAGATSGAAAITARAGRTWASLFDCVVQTASCCKSPSLQLDTMTRLIASALGASMLATRNWDAMQPTESNTAGRSPPRDSRAWSAAGFGREDRPTWHAMLQHCCSLACEQQLQFFLDVEQALEALEHMHRSIEAEHAQNQRTMDDMAVHLATEIHLM